MSIVFGVLAGGGEPIRPADLASMAAAASFPGQEPASVWQDAAIALGSARLALASESQTGVMVIASARLDNRPELGNPEATDPELILQAYLAWGEEFAEHLLGDFAVAIWDPRERKLVLARDHHGTSPLFYHAGGSLFAFANSTGVLLAHPGIPQKPDLLRLGQLLSTWVGDGGATGYQGIQRLPAGHMLVAQDNQTRRRAYWSLDPGRRLTFRSDEECLEAFSALYADAVACRLRTRRPVGISLSAGLDSGSVGALAARELAKRDLPLLAFTSVPLRPVEFYKASRLSDESPLVEEYRKTAPNIQFTYCKAEDTSPLAGIDRCLAAINEPVHGASNLYWMVSMSQAAQSQNVGVFLTGQMGNGTVSLRAQGPKTPREILASWVRPLRTAARRKAAGGDLWLAASPINSEFARSIRLAELRLQAGIDPNFEAPKDPEQYRLELMQLSLRTTGSAWHELGATYGMDVVDPTADKRIFEFCLAIPIEQFQSKGMDRALLRRSMQGVMPDSVRLSTRRGRQAADLGYRILATETEITQALAELERHPLAREVLDLPKMRRVLSDLKSHVNGSNTDLAGAILMRGLMVGRFLQRF